MTGRSLLVVLLNAVVSLGVAGCDKPGASNPLHATRPATSALDNPGTASTGLLFCEVHANQPHSNVAVEVLARTPSGEWAAPKRIFDIDDPDALHGIYPSPDGKAVVITMNDKPQMAGPLDLERDDIVLYTSSDNKLWRVTDDNYGYGSFLWSNDSRYFACSAPANRYSPLAIERAMSYVWVYDVRNSARVLVARHASSYGWGPEPNRLLFQKAGSSALYEYDAKRNQRTLVGHMPVRFERIIMGRWAYVSHGIKPDHEFYRLEASRKGGRTSVRAVLHLKFKARVQVLSGYLSSGGNRVILRTWDGSRPLVLDIPRRTIRYFQPPAFRAESIGWSSDGKGVLMVAPAWPEGPNKHDKNQVWSVLIDTVPATPAEKVDLRYAHRAQAVLIKETDQMTDPQVWLGPAR